MTAIRSEALHSLDRLAENLIQVAARLRDAAREDDGVLRRRHGTTLAQLRIMRDRAAAEIPPHDPRRAGLARVDAALAELAAAFEALPRAPLVILHPARPVQRRRSRKVARLDADTARLLKRATIVLGLSGATALPLAAAAAGSCTGTTTQVCTGDFSTGTLNGIEQVSTDENRKVEYDQYPAELLDRVVIYKTAQANRVLHGTPKALRKLQEACRDKAQKRLEQHHLQDRGDDK